MSILISHAINVTEYLTTSRQTTRFGKYLIYEDKKIKIKYHTYHCSLRIWVKINNENKLVFSLTPKENVTRNNTGKWQDYIIFDLSPKATAIKIMRENKEKEAHFGPIDDTKIFNKDRDEISEPKFPEMIYIKEGELFDGFLLTLWGVLALIAIGMIGLTILLMVIC